MISRDGIRISASLEKEDRYTETRKRIARFRNQFSISDKEIIEALAEEIEQYRDRIRCQEEYINELNNKHSSIDKLVAIYKADMLEYESGKIDILYECNKDNNKECNKRSCSKECCTHTLNKKYAKNYI